MNLPSLWGYTVESRQGPNADAELTVRMMPSVVITGNRINEAYIFLTTLPYHKRKGSGKNLLRRTLPFSGENVEFQGIILFEISQGRPVQ